MKQTIIFDLGGVLIDWDPVRPFIKVFKGDEDKASWFIKHICNHEWNAQLDAGRSFDELVKERIEEYPEFRNEIQLYQELWEHMLTGPIQGTVDILMDLESKSSTQLLAITNWSAETFPIARKKYDFLNIFEDIAVSGELKMIKPNPEIFEYMIKKHNLIPKNTIFIDDNEANIETSKKLGFISIHYKGSEQLKKDLKAYTSF